MKKFPSTTSIRGIFQNNFIFNLKDSIAQLVERRTCNANVVGSIPTGGSKYPPFLMNSDILSPSDVLFQTGQIIDKSQCEVYHCEWDNVHGDIVLFV